MKTKRAKSWRATVSTFDVWQGVQDKDGRIVQRFQWADDFGLAIQFAKSVTLTGFPQLNNCSRVTINGKSFVKEK